MGTRVTFSMHHNARIYEFVVDDVPITSADVCRYSATGTGRDFTAPVVDLAIANTVKDFKTRVMTPHLDECRDAPWGAAIAGVAMRSHVDVLEPKRAILCRAVAA